MIQLGDLDFLNSINLCNAIEAVGQSDEFHIDYIHLGNVEPFGMLIAGAKLRQLLDKFPTSKFYAYNFQDKGYAAHMGFFKSIRLDFGKAPGEALGSSNYIPITNLEVQKLREQSFQYLEHVGETIEKKANELAKVLSQENNDLVDYLTYSIRELIRNIVEHSQSENIWIAGQYWPSKDLVEIAILDEGIGIKKGLSGNPHLKIENDQDALLLAIEPGISGKAFRGRKRSNDVWANSGYGLYMTSSICQRGGSFVLVSGNQALYWDNNGYRFYPTNFNGTAIRMRIRVSQTGTLSRVLQQLASEGSKRAKENSSHSVLSASKVSRVLMHKYENL